MSNLQTKQLALVYGPALLEYDFGKEHPFNRYRATLAWELLEAVGLTKNHSAVTVLPTQEADNADLRLFHNQHMIDLVQNSSVLGEGYLDGGDTPAVLGGFEAAKAVVGSSWAVTEAVASGRARYGGTLVGGLHHAFPSQVSGFCVFNDLAINIIKLRRDYGLKRVAYIDIDAHHGDGVLYGFYDDPDLLVFDLHEDGRYLFPGTGTLDERGGPKAYGTKFNLPLPPYSSDQSFIYAMSELLPTALRRFQPEFILLQMGMDGHTGDPLTHLNYSLHSYRFAASLVKSLADELCDGKLVLYGGGGYNIGSCATGWASMIATLLPDLHLPDVLPLGWRKSFEATLHQAAPYSFDEPITTDNTFARVEAMVKSIRDKTGV